MGGFCRQNSLENPLPLQCDWNPSFLRDPKYARSSIANKNMDRMMNFI
jgi:hypothetical protein